jgi:hypothetical protein
MNPGARHKFGGPVVVVVVVDAVVVMAVQE